MRIWNALLLVQYGSMWSLEYIDDKEIGITFPRMENAIMSWGLTPPLQKPSPRKRILTPRPAVPPTYDDLVIIGETQDQLMNTCKSGLIEFCLPNRSEKTPKDVIQRNHCSDKSWLTYNLRKSKIYRHCVNFNECIYGKIPLPPPPLVLAKTLCPSKQPFLENFCPPIHKGEDTRQGGH